MNVPRPQNVTAKIKSWRATAERKRAHPAVGSPGMFVWLFVLFVCLCAECGVHADNNSLGPACPRLSAGALRSPQYR